MKSKVKKLTIQIIEADLLQQEADAIALATDPILTLPPELITLGGAELTEAVTLLGWCDVGHAVSVSTKLPHANTLILAAPPKWGEASARGKLANTIWDILQLAESLHIKTLATPPIGIGKFGHPIEATAHIMMEQILDYAYEPIKHLRNILICVSSDVAYTSFKNEFNRQIVSLDSSEDSQAGVG
ncbi:macro domain-containing protein [Phototrophicus methaneseepsis]|uniref:Macro domain-containing protein n=1 Tax=Phototrophicus methaneseepsis TaxID=2710758 RepID=A0A7S8IDB5_9CHLR|nr:macro domain-containing protein [Phototrophicus methaneseepsis]QPC81194.1 macro domain-containing protein [Phototrophicus methaneseepsis]